MKTTDSTPHKFLLPYNVNYRAPFRFVMEEAKDGIVYTCKNTGEGTMTINWKYDELPSVEQTQLYGLQDTKRYVDSGRWLVLDEQPSSFRFYSKDFPACIYTYDAEFGISVDGNFYTPCAQNTARSAIANGTWLVLPTTIPSEGSETSANVLDVQTAAEAESACFKATNSLVKPASKASTDSIHNYVGQACTQTQSRLNVLFLGDNKYYIYHTGLLDCEIEVVGEGSLREAVEALLVLDGVCKW